MSDPVASAPLPDEGVLGRMVDELLSDVAPVPRDECDARGLHIDDLEAIVRMQDNRIAEIEAERAQEARLREELEASRAQLTRERDQFEAMAREAWGENVRLSYEVARLQQCLEALKRLG
jgi:hypothetical protein